MISRWLSRGSSITFGNIHLCPKALRAQPTGTDAGRVQAAQNVRESLLKFFPRRHCTTLVQPVVEEQRLQRLAEAPYEELRPDFRGNFEAMQAQLLGLARASPKRSSWDGEGRVA